MKTIKLVLTAIFLLSCVSLVCAEETMRIAKVSEFEGTVEMKIASNAWAPAQKGAELKQGDIIRTKANSWAVLDIEGSTVEVKQNSQMKLAELVADKAKDSQKTLLDLALGEVLIKAKKLDSEKSRFEVKTPTSIVGVRGTTFSVAVEAVE